MAIAPPDLRLVPDLPPEQEVDELAFPDADPEIRHFGGFLVAAAERFGGTLNYFRKLGRNALNEYEEPAFRYEMDNPIEFESSGGTAHSIRIVNRRYLETGVVPLVDLNALGLRSDRGYKRMRLHQLAQQLERPIINVSSEGFEGHWLGLEQTLGINFEQMVQNVHEGVSKAAKYTRLRFDEVDMLGESRGAETALLCAQAAELHDRRIRKVVGVAPPYGAKAASPRLALALAKQFLLDEPPEVWRFIAQHGLLEQPALIWQLLPTALVPAKAIPAMAMTGLDILRGPMAKFAIPSDTEARILLFQGDVASHPEGTMARHEADANVECELREGSHLSILRRTTLEYEVEQLQAA